MEEVMKLLGPWPVLQLIFGLAVLGGGVWAIIKGQKKDAGPPKLTDQRAEWEAYQQLANIEAEAFKQTEILSRILDRMNNNSEQMKALSSAIWNLQQWRGPRNE